MSNDTPRGDGQNGGRESMHSAKESRKAGHRQAQERGPGELGWVEQFRETGKEISKDNASLVAAGVAFYFFLGIIPALAALLSIYGMVLSPDQVQQHMQHLSSVLPAEANPLEAEIMQIASDQTVAGWGAALSLLILLWSGSKATAALITATNLAYGCPERRGFFRLLLLRFGLTLAGVVFATLAIALVAVMPAILGMVGLDRGTQTLLSWARWPLLVVFFLLALAVLYRYAPARPPIRWRWVSPGAVGAGLLWVGGSLLFSLYVSQFADLNKTYGSLGVIVLLLLWLYLTAFAIIVGAEWNAVGENTKCDEEPADQGAREHDTRSEPRKAEAH
jgi:membrane protein